MNAKFAKLIWVWIALILFFVTISSINAQLGCCINPEFKDRRAFCNHQVKIPQEVCCPDNDENCITNYFHKDVECINIPECAVGCCCPEEGKNGKYSAEAACSSPNTFISGDYSCSGCMAYECSDGIDNYDEDGDDFTFADTDCADWQFDTACESPDDPDESGGACIIKDETCTSPDYNPKILYFNIEQIQGGKKLELIWFDECWHQNVEYQIRRCSKAREDCTSPDFIDFNPPIITKDTVYVDDAVDFYQRYTYEVVGRYSEARIGIPALQDASLGDLECLGQRDDNHLCIDKNYYLKFKDYLLSRPEFSGISEDEFLTKVEEFYGRNGKDHIGKRLKCVNSQLFPVEIENLECPYGTECVISKKEGKSLSSCVESACHNEISNPFGMYYLQSSDCESDPFCFWDRSYTIANNCFACKQEMKCYDYKTKESCESNNCGIGDCLWKPSNEFLGIGVCVDRQNYNCDFCEQEGSGKVENTKPDTLLDSYNNVFDVCTEAKMNLLSITGDAESSYLCFYKKGEVIECNNVICGDYEGLEDCPPDKINLNPDTNRITNRRDDRCSIGVCKQFGDGCYKDADGDEQKDCEDMADKNACERDYIAPVTKINLDESDATKLIVRVTDKQYIGDSESVPLNRNEYKTYICVMNCEGGNCLCSKDTKFYPSSSDIPSTGSDRLTISGLGIYEGLKQLIDFGSEGTYKIGYYSVDPSRNIESMDKDGDNIIDNSNMKTLIAAQRDEDGPIIGNIAIVENDGDIIEERSESDKTIYTNNPQNIRIVFIREPPISVELMELALIKETTGEVMPISLAGITPKNTGENFDIPLPTLEEDIKYLIKLNAKYSAGFEMRDINKCPYNYKCPGIIYDTTP